MSVKCSSNISVFVRVRPTAEFAQDIIKVGADNKTIDIHLKRDHKHEVVNNKRQDWSFKLDGFFHNASQEVIYDAVAKPIVSKALDGYNGTIMCYGQTGAGKTFTMTGATENYKQRGIIPRTLQQVFREIEARRDQSVTVRISYLEIYNENLFDLLSTMPDVVVSPETQLSIADDLRGVFVKGLSTHLTSHEEDALNLLFEGETNRIIATHMLNKNSSRSHCIFTIHLESRSRSLSNAKYTATKINLVDLAGSERLGKTGSEGQVLKEATYINKSLSFLEQTIIALADRRRDHIPFRQSKLTHALKDSLGGNCNTVLVANIYGEANQLEETLSTLRFATRMKCIPTDCVVVEQLDPERAVKNLEKEIALLKRELVQHDILVNRTLVNYEPLNETQIADIRSQVSKYLDGSLDEIDIINVRQIQEVFAQFKFLLSKQEQEVEARLRQKYTVPEKSDAGAVAQKTALSDKDAPLVGEVDGHSFGIGVAPVSSKHAGSPSAKKGKGKKTKEISSPVARKESVVSPVIVKEIEPASPSKTNLLTASIKEVESKEVVTREQEVISVDTQPTEPAPKEEVIRPSTPPAKIAAFEDFKNDRGSEINRIFKDNKAILVDRKAKMKEITQTINIIKHEIDNTKETLSVKTQERESQGEYISEEGQTIIDEEEFNLIVRLKDLKKQYRAEYDELRDLKAEIQYCERLVDQCRKRLLTEFDVWYTESFLIPEDVQNVLKEGDPIRPGLIPVNKIICMGDDAQETFDRLQHELFTDQPDSIAFYSAKIKSDQRHNYIKSMSKSYPMRKKPGVVTAAVRNKPPSVFSMA
ncbi:kinesin-like protein KIF9 [Ambystoma mexicanum]|uniref:kinesin-like protein KIF9 n=1 Tax=Ambystoma mexicanum TaxID=8296 RepID=UPI0037E8AF2D